MSQKNRAGQANQRVASLILGYGSEASRGQDTLGRLRGRLGREHWPVPAGGSEMATGGCDEAAC